jgi:hypothetical protein
MAVTTGADVTGTVGVIARNSIIGYNVYSTDLKLVSEAGWKPIQGHVPVPSAFVGENKVIALDKVALYDTEWFTQQTYEMLKRKRLSAEKYKKQFDSENMTQWYEMLMFQTESATASFNEYKSRFSRYIFVVENK